MLIGQTFFRHVSPDELLTFLVVANETGDVALSFEGYLWHTHAQMRGMTREEAVAQFLGELLGNKAVIATATIAGRVADVWVADDPAKPDRCKPDNEVITFRFWDGMPWRAGPFGKAS